MLATIWNTILFHPFLNVLVALYHLFNDNFGWAVVVIAIVTRLILIPASKKQMEMTKKMSSLRPRLAKLQKQFANNPQKLSQEQMKLYKEVGYNPLGCVTSFVPQILILYAIIQVINVVTKNNFDGLYPFVREWAFGAIQSPTLHTGFLFFDLTAVYTTLAKEFGYLSLIGLPYLILAVLVGAVQYVSTKFTQIMQGQKVVKTKGQKTPEQMQMEMMNSMNILFPIMTVVITVSMPAVLGIYWLVQSLMFIVQYWFIDKKEFMSALKQVFTLPKLNLKKEK